MIMVRVMVMIIVMVGGKFRVKRIPYLITVVFTWVSRLQNSLLKRNFIPLIYNIRTSIKAMAGIGVKIMIMVRVMAMVRVMVMVTITVMVEGKG